MKGLNFLFAFLLSSFFTFYWDLIQTLKPPRGMKKVSERKDVGQEIKKSEENQSHEFSMPSFATFNFNAENI